MPPVAIACPLWAAALRSLRDLTRLAVTALVLAAGLGGTTAASAAGPSADQVRPIVDTSGTLSAAPGQLAPTLVTGWVNEPRATSHPVADRAADAPARALRRTARPAAPAAVTAPPTPPGADPARDAVGRRGPPRG